GDPHQRARLGQAATAAETARLFVEHAARLATTEPVEGDRAVAYVALARGAVERAGLDAIELAQRSVGLSGFLEAHPLERLVRDLATYLRQPAPDGALVSAAAYVAGADAPVHALWHDPEPT
ncbi:acyl-CoA dehydrogenase family protein, partial [Methylobacterium sp. WL116]